MATKQQLVTLPRRTCVECLSHVSRNNMWVRKENSKHMTGKGWVCKDCYEKLRPRVNKKKLKLSTCDACGSKIAKCVNCGNVISSKKSNRLFCDKICEKKFKILT